MTVPSDPTAWTCASCLATFRQRPVLHLGLAFCCAGCAAGGPCACSYDEEDSPDAPEARSVQSVADHVRRLVGAAR